MQTENKITDYGLRFYVKGLYPANAAKRGGEAIKGTHSRYYINQPVKVIAATSEKYPITQN